MSLALVTCMHTQHLPSSEVVVAAAGSAAWGGGGAMGGWAAAVWGGCGCVGSAAWGDGGAISTNNKLLAQKRESFNLLYYSSELLRYKLCIFGS